MQPLLFGPVDTALMPIIEFLVLALVVVNLVTRYLAHRSHVQAAQREGADGIEHSPIHSATNVLLILSCFYYTTVSFNAGVLLSVLVLGMFLADFFEVEARKVEARTDKTIELPKAAIGASVLVLLYASYVALFFLVEPFWRAVV